VDAWTDTLDANALTLMSTQEPSTVVPSDAGRGGGFACTAVPVLGTALEVHEFELSQATHLFVSAYATATPPHARALTRVTEGRIDGSADGASIGNLDGCKIGRRVGSWVGRTEGDDGDFDEVGATVGTCRTRVGAGVG